MNKELQDKYILDYLEGNLSQSEQSLFTELVSTDPSFKLEYLKWRSTFFQKESAFIPFQNKKELLKPWHHRLVVPSLILLFISFGATYGYWHLTGKQDTTPYKSTIETTSKHETLIHETPKIENITPIEKQKKSPRDKYFVTNKRMINPNTQKTIEQPFHKNGLAIIDSISIQTAIVNSVLIDDSTLNKPIVIIDNEHIDLQDDSTSLFSDVIDSTREVKEKQTSIKMSRYARKIMRKEKIGNFKKEIPKLNDLKDGFKNQRVIPID